MKDDKIISSNITSKTTENKLEVQKGDNIYSDIRKLYNNQENK